MHQSLYQVAEGNVCEAAMLQIVHWIYAENPTFKK